MGAEAAIAVMRRREREVRRAFHDAGALDPSASKPLPDMGIEESWAIERLENRKVVRESSPGCYYFDEEVWQAVRATRIKMALMLLAAVGMTALVGLYAVSAAR